MAAMTPVPATDFARQDRQRVIWLSLAQLISWGTLFYTFALLMEPVERELGMSRTQSSLAFSMALLVEGLLGYPVGRLIDRGHGRLIMGTGSVMAALGFLALSWADSATACAVVRPPGRDQQALRLAMHLCASRRSG